MIAMQYSFALPADYDMDIIDRRVREKGKALDAHEPLIFKAYGVARRGDAGTAAHENLYAPFYLWKDTQGMNDFLCSAGFAGLVASFGWPVVRNWPMVLASEVTSRARDAAFSTRQIEQLPPFASLAELRDREASDARTAISQSGAVIAVSALEPATWTLVRYRAYPLKPSQLPSGGQVQAYDVRHVSHPPGL
jgi:hypothetical protein